MGPSPYLHASRESARAYKSIEHVVQCGGGSGVGGCNVDFVVTEDDVDVLEHYRTALADAGWRVVEDNGGHLRAERGRMAFELACAAGTVAKSGRAETPRGAEPTATTMRWSTGTHGTPGRRAPGNRSPARVD